jgi:hypothetical protein
MGNFTHHISNSSNTFCTVDTSVVTIGCFGHPHPPIRLHHDVEARTHSINKERWQAEQAEEKDP